jgi:Domain of unknown function (DUF4388)
VILVNTDYAFRGTFTHESLPALLQFVASTHRQGTLHLMRFGMLNFDALGNIMFAEGKLVAATAGTAHSDEALMSILGWVGGTFGFDSSVPGDLSARDRSRHGLDSLLIQSAGFDRWISTASPGAHSLPALTTMASDTQLHLLGRHLQIICRVNGHRTLAHIATDLALDVSDVQEDSMLLERLGIFDFTKAAPLVPSRFVPDLEEGLTAIVGPMAGFIVDDLLAQGGFDTDRLERDDAWALLRSIRSEVSPEQRPLVSTLCSSLVKRYQLGA